MLARDYRGGMAPACISRGNPETPGIVPGRPFEFLPLDETDLPAIAAILAKYAGLGIQLADASLVHLANRERIESIFTLDRRDFGVLRLAHGKRIRIIP